MIAPIDYLLIGPATVDRVPDGHILGGTVSYAAPIVKAFGHRVGIFTSAAAGESLLDELRQHAEVAVRLAGNTTTFSNVYTPTGRVQYVHAVAEPMTADFIPSGWLSAPLVHLAPLAGLVDPKIVHQFPDATVMFTPQGWMRQWGDDGRVSFKRWLDEDVLRAVDIVVFSKPDIKEAPELEQEFANLVKHLIVTDGARGGVYYHYGEAQPYTAFTVAEVEPTGAGDVFAASLLASLLRLDHNMERAIQVAAKLAAISVTRVGMKSCPTMSEVEEAIQLIAHT